MEVSYTYIVRCSDGTYYTGWTNSLEKRIRVHNSGRGAKYTRSRRPVELVYFETFGNKAEAMRREAAIKKLDRSQKESLVEKMGLEKETGRVYGQGQ
ncbi:MAG TPA: GIY-YIG nuclease family protein [Candidatus Choladousia intestinigallinarum]|nr:GIY-YIG nuclease family protein [Candidatus Choladousia intestinigallinarum]